MNPKHFLRSFVWLNKKFHNYLKESQKIANKDNPVLSIAPNCRRIFPTTFDDFHIFAQMFALYTSSFARSFASSINITGSPLVISHNRPRKSLTRIIRFVLVPSLQRTNGGTVTPDCPRDDYPPRCRSLSASFWARKENA